jgi:hypothetical protein
VKPNKPNSCEFCQRHLKLTFHHLVPKKMHKDKRVLKMFPDVDLIHFGIWICTACHKHLHKSFGHEDLAFYLNEKEKLLRNDKVKRFTNWASKQRKRIK